MVLQRNDCFWIVGVKPADKVTRLLVAECAEEVVKTLLVVACEVLVMLLMSSVCSSMVR